MVKITVKMALLGLLVTGIPVLSITRIYAQAESCTCNPCTCNPCTCTNCPCQPTTTCE